MSDREHSLQLTVLRYLREHGRHDCNWFAIPNAGRRSLRYGARMKAEGMQRGVADLCFQLPLGRAAWLELKSDDGTQSDEQLGFQAKCERLGHPYGVARTLEEAVAFCKRIGVLRMSQQRIGASR